MMQALPAPPASSAARDEGEHDVVASLDAADRGADGFDHAGGLVADTIGRIATRRSPRIT